MQPELFRRAIGQTSVKVFARPAPLRMCTGPPYAQSLIRMPEIPVQPTRPPDIDLEFPVPFRGKIQCDILIYIYQSIFLASERRSNPKNFPVNQHFACGDGFADDCVLRHCLPLLPVA